MAQATHFFLRVFSGEGIQTLAAPAGREMPLEEISKPERGLFLEELGRTLERTGTAVEYLQDPFDPDRPEGLVLPELGWRSFAPEDHERTEAEHRAFRSLSAARQLEAEATAQAAREFAREEAERRITQILDRLLFPGEEKGRTCRRFVGGWTWRGPVWCFDSVRTLCSRAVVLEDRWEQAGPLLELVRLRAVSLGWDVIACMAPEEPGRMEHLLIPGLDLAFVTSRPGMAWERKALGRLCLDDFAKLQDPGTAGLACHLADSLRKEAVGALREVRQKRKPLRMETDLRTAAVQLADRLLRDSG